MKKHTIIFIVGQTASGKTRVAAELAKRTNGEVVSCDSMQIYKDMDIITQLPAEEIRLEVPHHLVAFLSPEEEYSAARYAQDAKRVIEDIISRGKGPIFAGGTGLYMKALVDGIFPSPEKDEKYRIELELLAREKGAEHLHRMLEKIDRETAAKLHPNDVRRVIRALEVHKNTGKTTYEKKKETVGIGDEYEIKIFGLDVPRDILYERINARLDRMFGSGLVSEVEGLLERKLSKTARKALGIKEVAALLAGELETEEAKELLKKNTRNYAKRQLTWFRADKRVEWVDADRPVYEIVEEIIALLVKNVKNV